MNKALFTLLLFLSVFTAGQAQKQSIHGTVVDASTGEPVVGASVIVEGTPVGTVTNIDGNFTLNSLPKSATHLVVSYIGLVTERVPIKNNLKIVLKEEAAQIEDVYITAPYGTRKRSDFTGSVGFVDEKTLSKELVSNVTKALQGTVPGLQSFSSSGQPGSDASIYIRGVGSVNASSTPLYVVDGVEYNGNISNINTQDIESITVLKDAASAALYGSRAANGVVMIVTKQGKRDKAPTVNLSAKYGWSSRARADYEQLTTDEYFQLYWEALRNYRLDQGDDATTAATYATNNLTSSLGINPYGTDYSHPVGTDGKLVSGAKALWNDDWDDALTQNAHYQEYNLSVSGGSERSKYFISGGFLDDQGAYLESGFQRYTFRANASSDIKKWLRVGLNISGSHSKQKYPKQDDTMTSNIIYFARNLQGFYPIYERDYTTGEYVLDEAGNRQWDFGNYRPNSYAKMNLVATMPMDRADRYRDALSVRSFAEADILKGLTYKLTLNYDYNNQTNHSYVNPELGSGATSGGSVTKGTVKTTGFTVNNVLDYVHSFNQVHNLHLLAGQEYYEYNTSNFSGSRSNVVADGYYEPDAASVLSDFSGNSDSYKLLSWFGSAEYNYLRRYYLSASVRTDGSSRFSKQKRWGSFWSVGGSWKISEEKFLENAKGWIYNLGLRASYGAQGNDNVGYYAYQALYSIANNLGESGIVASRLGTPNLTWETNYNLNIALDFGLWDNRLSGSVEFFHRRSKDLLFSLDLVPSSGFSSMDANIGALKNVGWDVQLAGLPIRTQDWTWRLSANATTYKNTITSLPSSEMWSGNKKWVEGGSLYDWYLIEWAGVNPENGNPQWYGIDDNGEKYITEDYSSLSSEDKVKTGSSLPKVTGGVQSDLTWKDLTLSLFFSYSIGGKIYNGDYASLCSHGPSGTSWSKTMLDRWTPENTETDVPRVTTNPASSWTNTSSRFLVDRSYLKLKNISLSYNLPRKWTKRATLDSATLFVQAENLFTWCKQQGLDPEQNVGGTTYYRYPAMKTITIGVNVQL